MKYYGYCLIIALFLVMYFSMMFVLRFSMDAMIERKFNTKEMEIMYEHSTASSL